MRATARDSQGEPARRAQPGGSCAPPVTPASVPALRRPSAALHVNRRSRPTRPNGDVTLGRGLALLTARTSWWADRRRHTGRRSEGMRMREMVPRRKGGVCARRSRYRPPPFSRRRRHPARSRRQRRWACEARTTRGRSTATATRSSKRSWPDRAPCPAVRHRGTANRPGTGSVRRRRQGSSPGCAATERTTRRRRMRGPRPRLPVLPMATWATLR